MNRQSTENFSGSGYMTQLSKPTERPSSRVNAPDVNYRLLGISSRIIHVPPCMVVRGDPVRDETGTRRTGYSTCSILLQTKTVLKKLSLIISF